MPGFVREVGATGFEEAEAEQKAREAAAKAETERQRRRKAVEGVTEDDAWDPTTYFAGIFINSGKK